MVGDKGRVRSRQGPHVISLFIRHCFTVRAGAERKMTDFTVSVAGGAGETHTGRSESLQPVRCRGPGGATVGAAVVVSRQCGGRGADRKWTTAGALGTSPAVAGGREAVTLQIIWRRS